MKAQLLAELNAALEFFERSTRNLTEDDATYTPAEGTYTAAQQVAHAAQTIDWFVDGAFRPGGFDLDFEAHDRAVRAVSSLREARAWMTRAVENARAVIASKSEDDWAQAIAAGPIMGGQPRTAIFGAITDHTAHHRGALTVYARLRGKVPPMPYMESPS
jgi:uncharacterized damage-inducible protein DinB